MFTHVAFERAHVNKSSASNQSNNVIPERDALEICDNITSLAISGSETTGVTTFAQEACEQVDVLGKFYVPSSVGTLQPELQDLKEYFRRPRVMAQGAFVLNTRNNPVQFNFSDSNFETYFPGARTRLLGVYGMRFRTVFTLQIAATPFSQGVACLSFQYDTSTTDPNTFVRSKYACSATNIPHVRLDVSETTMVQLSVPYLNMREYLTINDGSVSAKWQTGVVAINTILPMRTGSGNNPTYRLYVHLEDLELVGAAPDALTTVNFQAGKPIDKEFANEAYPISSAVASASETFRWISRGVPSIRSLAGPTSWFLGKAAGAIRYFGWSKPAIQDAPVRMHVYNNILENNVDVPSNALVMGPMISNRLKVDPQFAATDVDEMALPFVLSQWCQVKYFTLSNSDIAGTLKMGIPISPASMYFNTLTSNSTPTVFSDTFNSFFPTGLFYWGNMFRQWRGDMKFRFTFGKTKMHAGRVIVYFTPSEVLLSQLPPNTSVALKVPDVTGGPHPFGYSKVFDLKDSNVFDFEVPYISDTPYKDFYGATGTLTMFVMDQINASSVISTTIDCMVEVCGSTNFELAVFKGNDFPANVSAVPRFQAGVVIPSIAENASEMAVGEHINSVKQIIAMPSTVFDYVALPNGLDKYALLPWWSGAIQVNLLPPSRLDSLENSVWNPGSYAARAYCYARGSTDYHVYREQPVKMSMWIYQVSAPGNVPPAFSLVPANNVAVPFLQTTDDTLHTRFPAYGRVARYVCGSLNNLNMYPSQASLSQSDTVPFQVGKLRTYNYDTQGTTVYVYRCAGDDAMLGHYMGPVPLAIQPTTGGTFANWNNTTAIRQSGRQLYHRRTGNSYIDPEYAAELDAEDQKNKPHEVAPPPTPSRNRSMRPPSPFKVSGDVGVKPDNLSGKLTSLLARAELLPKYANLTAQVAEVVSEALDQQ